jgi:hypothetical protein
MNTGVKPRKYNVSLAASRCARGIAHKAKNAIRGLSCAPEAADAANRRNQMCSRRISSGQRDYRLRTPSGPKFMLRCNKKITVFPSCVN